MIKHIVAWTFADAADKPARVDRVVELLTACSGLPGSRVSRWCVPRTGSRRPST